MKDKALARIILLLMIQLLSQFAPAQNVGIGTNSPTGPLSFASVLGNKLVLWGNGNSGHYGIGVQSGLLQLYSDAASANIGFGYGSSSSFNERMRILNNGNYDGMLLNGRLIIKNGSNDPIGGGGGVWLYKADNSALLGFMGTQNNQNIGFYGGPGGWGFTYDAINSRVGIGNPNPNAPLTFAAVGGKKIVLYPGTVGDAGFGIAPNRLQIFSDNPNADVAIGYDAAGVFNERFAVKPNGAIAFSGNTGQAGQVLKSSGPGASPTWGNATDLYNNIDEIAATGLITVNQQTFNDVPGLSKTINLTVTSKVVVDFDLQVDAPSCGFCAESVFDCIIMLNGNNTNKIRHSVQNGSSSTVTGKRIFILQAGSYTITLRVNNLTGAPLKAGYYSPPYNSYMYVETIPSQ